MFANIVETVYPPGKRAAGQAQIAEFHALAARQPGHRGVLLVDAGEGRILSAVFWEDEAAFEAARPTISEAGQRLISPLGATLPQRLGFGPVVRDTSAPGAGYAYLAEATAAPGTQAGSDEFRALADRQPGACGAIFVAAGAGRALVLRLWESEGDRQASAAVLREAFDRLIAPSLAEPGRILAAGPVVRDTLAHGGPPAD